MPSSSPARASSSAHDRAVDTNERADDEPAATPPPSGSVRLPDGCVIQARGLRRPRPDGPPPDFGLFLGSTRLRRRHDPPLTWPRDWIDWPDFWVPRDTEAAVSAITGVHERARRGQSVEVACDGGVGRTGTVIACLAVLAGVPPREAVPWARRHHHRHAVETPWQRRWVGSFAARVARA